MKRYIVNIDEEEYIVEIEDTDVYINGIRAEETNFSAINDQGLYLIQSGTEKQEIHIQRETTNDFQITVDGHHLSAQIERDNGRKSQKKRTTNDDGSVTAPMPALIIEVSVSEGDTVEEGQILLVLEAMKMQMKIKSPSRANVKRICRQAGDRVEKGEVLLHLEQLKL